MEGDILEIEKEERIEAITEDSAEVVYAGDAWLLMLVDDSSEESALFKYDLEKKRPVELVAPEENVQVYFTGDEYPVILQDGIIVMGEKKIFHLNPVTEEVKVIYSSSYLKREWDYSDDMFYFRVESDLYLYDGISDSAECILTVKDLQKECRKQRKEKLNYAWIRSMYIYRDRWFFYVNVQRKKSSEEMYNTEELYSISIRDYKKIRYEEELMKYMNQKQNYEKKYSDYGGAATCYINTCKFVGFREGQVLASYPGDTDSRFILYDLQTKRIRDMAKDRLPRAFQDLVEENK